jgi:hypothetical protein
MVLGSRKIEFFTGKTTILVDQNFIVSLTPDEIEECRRIATARHKSKSPFAKDFVRLDKEHPLNEDIQGVHCEMAFEKLTGLKMNRKTLRSGDRGIDFECNGVRIGTISAKKPNNLLLRSDVKTLVHLIVLAAISEDYNSIAFLGWELTTEMKKQPTAIFDRTLRYENHYKSRESLENMEHLMQLIECKFEDEGEIT